MVNSVVLDLYLKKYSMRRISEETGIDPIVIRKHLIDEGLAIKMKDREASYAAYLIRLNGEDTSGPTDQLVPVEGELVDYPGVDDTDYGNFDDLNYEATGDNHLHHKLNVAERALIRARDELNYYRANVRTDERRASLEDKIEEIVTGALQHQVKHHFGVTSGVSDITLKSYVSMMLLSDIHAEELVVAKNVGKLNEYNWEIMEARVSHLFREWLLAHQGEEQGVIFLLGDTISGIIHNTLEHTTKPTTEAVHDLAEFLSQQIGAASHVFPRLHLGIVSGNHERISEKPSSANKGFDFGYLFAQILKAKLTPYTNITVDISTTGFTTYTIGDKVCLGHHGDMYRGTYNTVRTTKIQQSCEAVTGLKPDHIFEGHTHNFSHHNTDTGISLINASVIGPNEYGLTAGFAPNRPSQTLIRFKPTGVVEAVKQIFLDT